MNKNDLDNYQMPKLGREIARFFVNISRAVKGSVPGKPRERLARAQAFIRRNYLAPVFLIALVLAVPWVMLLIEVGGSLFEQVRTPIETDPDAKRAQFYAMGLTVTGIGALLAPPFVLIKAWVNERTATTAEQGHITERMTKAIEQLGAEKTVYKADSDGKPITEPNLEVRLGAIYALERIAQDSERDKAQIAKLLCAYVRENTNRAVPLLEPPFSRWDYPNPLIVGDDHAQAERRHELHRRLMQREKWANAQERLERIPSDVRAGLAAIASLHTASKSSDWVIDDPDLSEANFQRAGLSDFTLDSGNFGDADFSLARILRSEFHRTSFRSAAFVATQMQRVVFSGCDLSWARLEDADCRFANLANSRFFHANAEGAFFTDADLSGSDLFHALFSMADFSGTRFHKARCRGADLHDALNLKQHQLNAMFGDESTIIPPDLHAPDHWPSNRLPTPFSGDPEYEYWLARGAPPGEPIEG